jgi:hypothetical protein
MPDPVIRPGGWPFASWFPTGAPQAADRHRFDESELELAVTCGSTRLALGQPLDLSWTMTNKGTAPLVAPNDVSIEALFAGITVTDAEGRERSMRSFVILCDHAKLAVLEPGQSVSATTKVFWSSAGFAFERPGRYHVGVSVDWSAQGVPVRVDGGVDIFVDYPTSDAENHAAGLMLHHEVGKWVALGGGAYHLGEACRRFSRLADGATQDSGSRVLRSLGDVLPDQARIAKLYPEYASGTSSNGRSARTAKASRRSSGRKGRRS